VSGRGGPEVRDGDAAEETAVGGRHGARRRPDRLKGGAREQRDKTLGRIKKLLSTLRLADYCCWRALANRAHTVTRMPLGGPPL
jgi:hypothetical protein